jgi:hypothetical protein
MKDPLQQSFVGDVNVHLRHYGFVPSIMAQGLLSGRNQKKKRQIKRSRRSLAQEKRRLLL